MSLCFLILKDIYEFIRLIIRTLFFLLVLVFSACTPSHQKEVDKLNDKAYSFHYRNIDSTKIFAQKALALSSNYDAGQAEALNNLAFVSLVRMDYKQAYLLLDHAISASDNQIELLVAYIQQMRLCQRQSQNKNFYDCQERALNCLHRIDESSTDLSDRERLRMVYARSEFNIVSSTYYYYTGQNHLFIKALERIDANECEVDTAQYLKYLYNIGEGGAITHGSSEQIAETEFNYLIRCFYIATVFRSPYWIANSLEAISEHMQDPRIYKFLIRNNQAAIELVNTDNMPYRLLAGNLAQRSLELFIRYGDIYQIAGAYRTLGRNYWAIGDYRSALICLNHALRDKRIFQAPDLVASIREQLSLAYSAVNDKQASDYNRNIYLDLQEQTRQDRLMEARASELDKNATQLNAMILAVVLMIIFFIALLFVFDWMRRKSDRGNSADKLLQPLWQWKKETDSYINNLSDKYDEIQEETRITQIHILKSKQKNLEQRAKVQLVISIIPFIDRIINEIHRLQEGKDNAEIRKLRYQYISELTNQINQDNTVLTRWIQLRQGQLSLHIESFPVEAVFEVVRKGNMAFLLRGITFNVEKTDAIVKADRTLTLFMVNTMADNARRYVQRGGTVTISACEGIDYVEISVSDTGRGMTPDQVEHIFDHKAILGDEQAAPNVEKRHSHGFGLLNCKGIIEKYKKTSSLFRVCSISAKSELGKGSRFSFRLPKGISHLSMLLFPVFIFLFLHTGMISAANNFHSKGKQAVLSSKSVSHDSPHRLRTLLSHKASQYADSVYFSNIYGRYRKALAFADSTRYYLNAVYKQLVPHGKVLMKPMGGELVPPEILWFRDNLDINYIVILDMRNESAIACLALHDWPRYTYNNTVYTQLFREVSADQSLDDYVQTMQKSENSKTVAIVLLVLLLLSIFPAYYFLYYRHRVFYRFCVERIEDINQILLSNLPDREKLHEINQLWDERVKKGIQFHSFGFHSNDVINQLDQLVEQICTALRKSISVYHNHQLNIELAQDELSRAHYEDARLHVSNAVLDNCLSTLKHETMYYPSRIKQLIDGSDRNLEAISELAGYYKELYSLLSAQALRLTVGQIRLDPDLLNYLLEILQKKSGEKKIIPEVRDKGVSYVVIRIPLKKMNLTEVECHQLFTPLTKDLDFLLCKQIVREVGNLTDLRSCGIEAMPNPVTAGIIIEMVLPKKIWINLK